MREILNQNFSQMYDDGGMEIAGVRLEKCTFNNCGLSLSKNPFNISRISDVIVEDGEVINCTWGRPAKKRRNILEGLLLLRQLGIADAE